MTDPTETLAAWLADHMVTVAWERGWHPTSRFTCHAPADGLCRARWACECEVLYDVRIRNGVPAHRPDPDDPDTWHAGTFEPGYCGPRDWFKESSEVDRLDGEVTFPVVARWEDVDDVVFEPVDAMPRLLAFAEAVLALHYEQWGCGNPSHTNPEAGCPECYVCCNECGDGYPCATVTALAEHLGGEGQ